ncbi:MAG TPA: EamA family transporter [Bryobacteraceae bacterium]|nr:EamA family transporter [Bryobacteraceae bacterium]
MTAAYWYVLAGLLSFAAMGVIHKLGDHYAASPLHIAVITMVSSCVFSLTLATGFAGHSLGRAPLKVSLIALPFGASAALALWMFQSGLRYGRIATSWLLINLSAAIPTVLSVWVYHEPLSRRKAAVLGLVALSLVLLWWDRKQDAARLARQTGEGD